ncbi:MAG: acyltransferase [Bacteroidia bacterium]
MSLHTDTLFNIDSESHFISAALQVFRHQYNHCSVYRAFASALGKTPDSVAALHDIPFLPVEFFKTHRVYSSSHPPQITFTSSGTTGQITSRHEVADVNIYETSFLKGFERFYGNPAEWTFLCLLPSYLEREGSSLVYMADVLIRKSASQQSGFYLKNYRELSEKLRMLNASGTKTLLLGVTYALLDLAEQFPQALENITIMETGGMKGKRREMIREELHSILKSAFHVNAIHSEYGMTELLSQAYSLGEGKFFTPPWMKILIREMNDPFSFVPEGKTGGVNIIDLANIHSCSFIATSDLGKIRADGSFEILGRFDNSDIRGCNLMVQ